MTGRKRHNLNAIITVVGAICLATGCGHVKPPSGGTIGNAIALNESARAILAQAKPHTSEPATSLLAAASRDLDRQKPMLEADQERAGRMEKKLIALDDDWVGPRARRAFWWMIGVGGTAYIVLGLLGAWFAPAFFGRLILTNVFAPFAWLARHIGQGTT